MVPRRLGFVKLSLNSCPVFKEALTVPLLPPSTTSGQVLKHSKADDRTQAQMNKATSDTQWLVSVFKTFFLLKDEDFGCYHVLKSPVQDDLNAKVKLKHKIFKEAVGTGFDEWKLNQLQTMFRFNPAATENRYFSIQTTLPW